MFTELELYDKEKNVTDILEIDYFWERDRFFYTLFYLLCEDRNINLVFNNYRGFVDLKCFANHINSLSKYIYDFNGFQYDNLNFESPLSDFVFDKDTYWNENLIYDCEYIDTDLYVDIFKANKLDYNLCMPLLFDFDVILKEGLRFSIFDNTDLQRRLKYIELILRFVPYSGFRIALLKFIELLDSSEKHRELLEGEELIYVNKLIKNIYSLLSRYELGKNKYYMLVNRFGFKDSLNVPLLVSPYLEDVKGVYLYSANGSCNVKNIRSLKDDIESYIGHSVSISTKKGFIFICEGGFSSDSFRGANSLKVFDDSIYQDGFINFGFDCSGVSFGRGIKEDKHLLIVGKSDSGKSNLQQTIINQIKFNFKNHVDKLYLIDLKYGVEFFEHRKEGEIEVYSRFLDVCDMVGGLVSLIENRYEEMLTRGEKKWNGKRVFCLIDEYAQISLYSPVDKEEKVLKDKLIRDLSILSSMGRACGFKLIVGLQKSTTDMMKSDFKENMHDRILMKAQHNLALNEVFGTSDFEGEQLPKPLTFVRGEMLCLLSDKEKPIHGRSYMNQS